MRKSKPNQTKELLSGSVFRVVYRSPDGWTVFEVQTSELEVVTAVGVAPGLAAGETISAEGTWKTSPKYGRQFSISTYTANAPTGRGAFADYLSGFPHIGPMRAEALVERFGVGEDLWRIIEEAPHRLAEIPGITPERAQWIATAYREQRASRDTIVRAKQIGLTDWQIHRLHDVYGAEWLHVVETDPYRVIRDVVGFGFAKADAMALGLGVALDSPFRARAAVLEVVRAGAESGDCYQSTPELSRELGKLSVASTVGTAAIRELITTGELVAVDLVSATSTTRGVGTAATVAAEIAVARRLAALARRGVTEEKNESRKV